MRSRESVLRLSSLERSLSRPSKRSDATASSRSPGGDGGDGGGAAFFLEAPRSRTALVCTGRCSVERRSPIFAFNPQRSELAGRASPLKLWGSDNDETGGSLGKRESQQGRIGIFIHFFLFVNILRQPIKAVNSKEIRNKRGKAKSILSDVHGTLIQVAIDLVRYVKSSWEVSSTEQARTEK